MTQEEKQLLLQDLCARLPYGVIIDGLSGPVKLSDYYSRIDITKARLYKPYLRSMSSMTKEEYAELKKMTITSPNLETAVTLFCEHYYNEVPNWRNDWTYCSLPKVLDWLNKKMFDYYGLIEKNLALEAPEGMYNIKEKQL